MSKSGESDEIRSPNTLADRIDLNRPAEWFLLDGNRLAATAVVAGAIFAAFILVSTVAFPSLQAEIRSADTVETMFSTMIGTVITGTTLVVTISQLVISQENGPLGDQRQRMSDAMDFRTYATELFEEAPEADPAAFLGQLLDVNKRRADALEDELADADDELRRQTGELLDSIRKNADMSLEKLEDAEFGTFGVLDAALDYNYSWKIYQVERLTDEFADALNDDQREAFRRLETALTMFGPAREHIKTLYFQWELIDLSRYILYAAVPALTVAGTMLAFVGAETFGEATLGVPNVTWVVAAAFTLTLTPFLIFLTYILRIVVVAKHTLAIGPFVLRQEYSEE
ncbi:hypothetical protein M0R88_14505 [Halorussus gelatinilyticus]|uniref:DUF4239 domain-containing protein n=1 Tax=Halorussus gelatinilyticus TaxID=2937524 RepID=A0A8U0II11_9EURY|nr:hypothetical protein [Halorussus gelatinilyticus]UPV99718.1 hypothetical protein M0R88_14505 [Halorussus gelatinilyticus]